MPKRLGDDERDNLIDAGNPYQTLANAIVMVAVDDYRKAREFLSTHKDLPEMSEYLSEEEVRLFHTNEQQRVIIRRGASYQRYYRACKRFTEEQITIANCRKFFLGPMMQLLTKVDGVALLERLDKETSQEISGDKV